MAAFKQLGGRLSERESGRYEIRHVPADIRDRDRQTGTAAPRCCTRYERVTFDKDLTRPAGKPKADLLAPGHPLLDAVTDLIIERYGTLLKQGTMLADRHDPGTEPAAARRGHPRDHRRPRPGPHHHQEVRLRRDRTTSRRCASAGEARYLDYEPLDEPERMVASPLRDAPWLASGVETVALDWAVTEGMPAELARTRDLVTARVAQVRRLVKQRLTGEINYWDMRHAELLDAAGRRPVTEDEAGDRPRPRPRPGTPPGEAARRPGPRRGTDRPAAGHLRGRAGHPAGPARQAARRPGTAAAALARDTARDRPPRRRRRPRRRTRASAATRREMPHNNPGYDIASRHRRRPPGIHRGQGPDRGRRRVLGDQDRGAARQELGGRIPSRDGIRVTPTAPSFDQVRYIVDPFRDVDFGDFAATGIIGNWAKEWERGGDPV